MPHPAVLAAVSLIILPHLLVYGYKEVHGLSGKLLPKAATFNFPEYAYKETSKNEITYHELEVECDHHVKCANLSPVGVARINCIRRCISPSCYQDIYAFNEVSAPLESNIPLYYASSSLVVQLEEGEIDARLNSFKGCVIQRM
ncbi:hypothetical protein KR018_012507 [Drosophila ironensis]|nr:hypothetical protein KR018_012507 [Drosophila ironensis]